jgi:hypothetical protein
MSIPETPPPAPLPVPPQLALLSPITFLPAQERRQRSKSLPLELEQYNGTAPPAVPRVDFTYMSKFSFTNSPPNVDMTAPLPHPTRSPHISDSYRVTPVPELPTPHVPGLPTPAPSSIASPGRLRRINHTPLGPPLYRSTPRMALPATADDVKEEVYMMWDCDEVVRRYKNIVDADKWSDKRMGDVDRWGNEILHLFVLSAPVAEEGVASFAEMLFERPGYVSLLDTLTFRTVKATDSSAKGAEYLESHLADFVGTTLYNVCLRALVNDEPEPVKSRMHCTAVTTIFLFELVWEMLRLAHPRKFSVQSDYGRRQAIQEFTNRRLDTLILETIGEGTARSVSRRSSANNVGGGLAENPPKKRSKTRIVSRRDDVKVLLCHSILIRMVGVHGFVSKRHAECCGGV